LVLRRGVLSWLGEGLCLVGDLDRSFFIFNGDLIFFWNFLGLLFLSFFGFLLGILQGFFLRFLLRFLNLGLCHRHLRLRRLGRLGRLVLLLPLPRLLD